MSVCDNQVLPSIIVELEECGSPPQEFCVHRQAEPMVSSAKFVWQKILSD